MKKTGLFFGTFNPIHVGHLIIANYMADCTDLDEVWMVVSPHNPLKEKKSLLADYHRLALVKEAIVDNNKLQASNIEFNLPKPSYTSYTLSVLTEKHPENKFVLIMGEDNLRTLKKWKNHEQIIENYQIYVYPRALTIQEEQNIKKENVSFFNHKNVELFDVPVMKISSSYIRNAVKQKKDIRYLLTEPVHQYLTEMHFYE